MLVSESREPPVLGDFGNDVMNADQVLELLDLTASK